MEMQKVEFVLYINNRNKIICARNFSVENFNPECINSLEIKEMVDSLVGMNNGTMGGLGIIPADLKKKSVDYLWEFYNPYKEQQVESKKVANIFENEDIFYIDINKFTEDGVVNIAKGSFSGNFFPTKVRYQVDIKDLIPKLVSEIRYSLSRKNYTHKYDSISL